MYIWEFGCSIGIFLNSANLICRSTDISKCFKGSLRLPDNESRLYHQNRIKLYSDCLESDQTPRSVTSDLGLYCFFSVFIFLDAGHQWANAF